LIHAQHFLIGTASLSVLGYKPHHPDHPDHPDVRVISLWNATPAMLNSTA
jgi:hypothetical protein